MQFQVLVVANDFLPARDGQWQDCGEGPWDTAVEAVTFAKCEVGVPWVVVNDENIPQAIGNAVGILWTAVMPTQLRRKGRGRKPRDAELWRKID